MPTRRSFILLKRKNCPQGDLETNFFFEKEKMFDQNYKKNLSFCFAHLSPKKKRMFFKNKQKVKTTLSRTQTSRKIKK